MQALPWHSGPSGLASTQIRILCITLNMFTHADTFTSEFHREPTRKTLRIRASDILETRKQIRSHGQTLIRNRMAKYAHSQLLQQFHF